jgi:hypothetical protein
MACAPITGAAGSYFQFTGMVNWNCLGNSTDDAPLMIVDLNEDGISIATCLVTPGAHARKPVFDFFACLPIAWWKITDGLPHTYSVSVTTDNSDGVQIVEDCALFVNNVAA